LFEEEEESMSLEEFKKNAEEIDKDYYLFSFSYSE